MAVAATGAISLPMESLRVLVANCTNWQDWCDASTAAQAKESIYLVDIPPPESGAYTVAELETMRPLVRIDLWEPQNGLGGEPWTSDRIGDRAYQDSCKLILDFMDDVPPEDGNNAREAKLRFSNKVGLVMNDLKEKSGDADYLTAAERTAGLGGLCIHKIELYQAFQRADEALAETQGDFYRVQFVCHCGV